MSDDSDDEIPLCSAPAEPPAKRQRAVDAVAASWVGSRPLEETMRQLCGAARVIGDANLEVKFKSAIDMLKRDIIFAASLYL